jgi:hypothetical protein
MPRNSIEGSPNQTDLMQIGHFLRSPQEVIGATSEPDRAREMQGRALGAEVDALTGTREDQVKALETGAAQPGTREELDGTNEALLDATAELIDHEAASGAKPKDK